MQQPYHDRPHHTTAWHLETNSPPRAGVARGSSRAILVYRCDFPSSMLRCAGTWTVLFRGNNGTARRTPSLAALHHDAPVDGSHGRTRWEYRTPRPDAGRQLPRAL